MSRIHDTFGSYTVFSERVPRIDQQVRVALHCVDLLFKDGVGNLRDLIAPADQPGTEDRMEFVHRRASERSASLGSRLEEYIIDRGFGTETARAVIKHRQACPPQAQPEEQTWLP
jgi:hypothetical protein